MPKKLKQVISDKAVDESEVNSDKLFKSSKFNPSEFCPACEYRDVSNPRPIICPNCGFNKTLCD